MSDLRPLHIFPRLSDDQIISLAAFERYHGKGLILPPGPRRTTVLLYAGWNAIAVASAPLYEDPIITIIEEDGSMELSEAQW